MPGMAEITNMVSQSLSQKNLALPNSWAGVSICFSASCISVQPPSAVLSRSSSGCHGSLDIDLAYRHLGCKTS